MPNVGLVCVRHAYFFLCVLFVQIEKQISLLFVYVDRFFFHFIFFFLCTSGICCSWYAVPKPNICALICAFTQINRKILFDFVKIWLNLLFFFLLQFRQTERNKTAFYLLSRFSIVCVSIESSDKLSMVNKEIE